MAPIKQEYIIGGIVVVLCVIALILYISQPWRRRPLPAATATKKTPMPVSIPRIASPVMPPPPVVAAESIPPLPMQPSSVGRRQNQELQPSSVGRRQEYDMHTAKAQVESEPTSSDEDKHRQDLMRGSMVGRRAMVAPTTSALMMGAINTRDSRDPAERGNSSSAVMDRHLTLTPKSGSGYQQNEVPQPYHGDGMVSAF